MPLPSDAVAIFSFSGAHAQAVEQQMGSDEALGHALAAEYASREPKVCADEFIVGMPGSASLVQLNINGLVCANEVPQVLRGTPAEADAIRTIETCRPRTTQARFAQAKQEHFTSEELLTLQEPSLGWGGGWGGHAILGYERILRDGVSGLKQWVRQHMERAPESQRDWYRALLHVCDGISTFIRNHARRAAVTAMEASGDQRRVLQQVAAVCEHVSRHGARDLHEAVQLFWFIHTLDDTDSPGRIDQFLLPWYLRLADDPQERHRLAYPILDALWRKFIRCRSWNVCLAGQTPDGRDATNELTWLFLDLQEKHGREAPNLSVRFFHGSDPRLLQRCVQVLSKGSGLPALYNDELLVPALCDLGIPLEHARDYALNGCAQVDIPGRSHMGLEDGEMNLAKCLELALRGGRSPITGKQAGAQTLPPEQIRDLPTLLEQLKQQIEYCTRLHVRSANLFQQVIAETGPHLLRSLFIDPCVERGADMKRGGALYNHGQFLTQGIANTADSLYAIARLIFDEQRLSLSELVRILDADWQGHEPLRREITERLPKFGNDREEVDRLAAQAMEYYFRFLNTQHTWRASAAPTTPAATGDSSPEEPGRPRPGTPMGTLGIYSGGVIVYVRAIPFGRHLSATPDGRRSGQPVADSIGPSQGCDRHGPTAVLKSVARLPQRLGASAQCLNLKFTPSLFTGGNGQATQKIASLFRTYFDLGGQQLQVNVVSRDMLLAAQQDSQRHPNLVVRVGGFCARFIDLERAQQDDIIARTSHAV